MIPKIFHWNWLSNDPIPSRFRDYMVSWLKWNPGWKVYFWTGRNLPPLFNQASFDDAKCWAIKSCILRLELVYQFGGIYLDSDFECYQPIAPLLDRSVIIGYETQNSLCDAILGADQGHPFFRQAVNDYPGWYEKHRAKPHQIKTPYAPSFGPEYLTHIYSQGWNSKFAGIQSKILYPYYCGESPKRYPETIAAHHWAGTWR